MLTYVPMLLCGKKKTALKVLRFKETLNMVMCKKQFSSRFVRTLIISKLILLFLFTTSISHAQQIDLLLKGGHVIEPKNKIDGQMDVAITEGKISQVAKDIPAKNAKKVIDVRGLYVTPGIIDMHVHVFNGTDLDGYIANAPTSVPADAFTFRAGVTTVVDAGSSGWRNFRIFKKQT